jgi:cobalt-zinc-cadmium efflux system protein
MVENHNHAHKHSHAPGQGHHHSHSHIDPDAGDARIAWAIGVNMLLTVAQVVGGVLSGSLALIADALHNFSDAISLIIAFFARKIARRPADVGMSFGYGRAEVVAALINYTTLIVLALYLIYEGIMRFLEPQPIDGWMVVWIAIIALVIDLVTAALTYSMSKDSMNIRAAFLHNVADALGSVAVIVAGTLVILYGWNWVDPLVTLMIAGYILWHVKSEFGEVVRVLMLGSPQHLDTDEIISAIETTQGVESIHHVHLWAMQERSAALEAHLVIAQGSWAQADEIKAAVKALLGDQFDISHSTLEMECSRHACVDPNRIGHG